MTRRKADRSGFSLIETMVCLVIASLLIVAASSFFNIHHQVYNGQSERVAIQDNARGAMDFIVRSMKHAVVFPVATAQNGSLSFSVPVAFGRSTGSNGSNTLNDAGQAWIANAWSAYRVVITSGTGQNQVRTISANTATQLTVSTSWAVPPDDTSAYKIISDKQFTLAGTSLQYRDNTTNASAILVDNISSFVADRSGAKVNIAMTAQTDRKLPDSGALGESRLVSSVDLRN